MIEIAKNSLLINSWTLWMKLNDSEWKQEHFTKIFEVSTIADMWGLLHNIPESWVSTVNMFFMSEDTIPLVECNDSLFADGGAWSVVVKRNEWRDSMNEIVASLFCGTLFSSFVKGLCLVPVTKSHLMVKLWSTKEYKDDGTKLETIFDGCTSRFKKFNL